MKKLHIETSSKDSTFTIYLVEGLSVDEVNEILKANDRRDALVEVMGRHENDSRYGRNIAEAWRCGYGIYGIRHFGGHLLVTVGNSCD